MSARIVDCGELTVRGPMRVLRIWGGAAVSARREMSRGTEEGPAGGNIL